MCQSTPLTRLKVKYFVRRIYYCDIVNHPNEKEEIYFEREIELLKKDKVFQLNDSI